MNDISKLKQLAGEASPDREGTWYFQNHKTRDDFIDLAVSYFERPSDPTPSAALASQSDALNVGGRAATYHPSHNLVPENKCGDMVCLSCKVDNRSHPSHEKLFDVCAPLPHKQYRDSSIDLIEKGIVELRPLFATPDTAPDLRKAAQALIDRWDTPKWKDVVATSVFIEKLRCALRFPTAPDGVLNAAAEFIGWALANGPWDGCDLDGASVQDKAEALGLIIKTKYDPVEHGESECAELGDDWFVLSPAITLSTTTADKEKRTAPESCPDCFNESDCSNVDICNAVNEVYAADGGVL